MVFRGFYFICFIFFIGDYLGVVIATFTLHAISLSFTTLKGYLIWSFTVLLVFFFIPLMYSFGQLLTLEGLVKFFPFGLTLVLALGLVGLRVYILQKRLHQK